MEPNDILNSYHSLFSNCFIENCKIDNDEITSEEQKALEDLDPSEVYENFADLIIELLKFKKQFVSTDQAELVTKANSFESIIQKLENEVRNHIAIEHQLKLLLENYQNKVEDLEGANIELSKKLGNKDEMIRDLNAKIEEFKGRIGKHLKKSEDKKENFIVKSKEFKPTHKRIKSDFDALHEHNKKSAQTIKSVKFEYFLAKANKMFSKKLKSAEKMGEINDRIKTERKPKAVKSKHLRSSSDVLAFAKLKQ